MYTGRAVPLSGTALLPYHRGCIRKGSGDEAAVDAEDLPGDE